MNTKGEKPWILDTGSYKLDPIQIDQEERDNLMRDIKEDKIGATLRNGSYISLNRNIRIIANKQYISPESIKRTRKKREYWNEFQHLKEEGVVKTKEEYMEWKKKKKK